MFKVREGASPLNIRRTTGEEHEKNMRSVEIKWIWIDNTLNIFWTQEAQGCRFREYLCKNGINESKLWILFSLYLQHKIFKHFATYIFYNQGEKSNKG